MHIVSFLSRVAKSHFHAMFLCRALTIELAVSTNCSTRVIQAACRQLSVQIQVMREVLEAHPDMVIIDYTLPAAVNSNCEFYCEHGVPFVMGTTGGDRDLLWKTAEEGGVYAVIAPQMGKQVVAFQAMMDNMATTFPGAFAGYSLEVIESHQRTKVDTSGTAKAVVESLRALGASEFSVADIQKVRNQADQIELMGVPKEHLDGHAFHTYRLKSPDQSVSFEFQHNVCGRTIYAEGTVDAALFLAGRIAASSEKRVYNMIDVLKAGSMR
jgi:4-hydroxy-tetrahydrodipicolinate reductase